VDIVVRLISRTCFKSLADKIIELELARESEENAQGPHRTFRDKARALIHNLIPPPGGELNGAAEKKTQISYSLRHGKVTSESSQISPVCEAQLDAAHGFSF